MLLEANAVRNNLVIDYFSSVGFFMTVITSRCFYCILLLLNNSLSSRKISLFNTFHSIDILPGPVNSRLIHTAIKNNSSSYPPTKPFDILTRSVAPIISIIKSAAVILATTPTSRKIPPITSYRLIGIASSGGRPILPKKP
ncbi:MAG: hypothetical protein WAM88_04305 [Nitrososphaeraceae archaeon]